VRVDSEGGTSGVYCGSSAMDVGEKRSVGA
jgi:hypothetical protein